MSYEFSGFSDAVCKSIRNGDPDANGQTPEKSVSDGGGDPCRCCLKDIPKDRGMLIFAHRPFEIINPYAEVGPVFICADCVPYDKPNEIPPVLATRPRHLLKGYSADDRIVYGTGEIVEPDQLQRYLGQTFKNPKVRYVHVRSATNNCFTLRIDAIDQT